MEFMGTRLFPKDLGADQYIPSGIAKRCDWIIFTDNRQPRSVLFNNTSTPSPKTIFLSLRSPFLALAYFVKQILPKIEGEFILFSGSADITLPNQMDKRWRKTNDTERQYILEILNTKLLKGWHCENLDEKIHPKLHPLPTGMVYEDNASSRLLQPESCIPLSQKPLNVFCAHRIRKGAEWELRRHVTALAEAHWADFCTVSKTELPKEGFLAQIKEHSFVACVEGGGRDPSPTAWHSLLYGAIPILRKSVITEAYSDFPVVIIDDWTPDAITPEKLARWHEELAPQYSTAKTSDAILEKLGLDYWWSKALDAKN